MNKKKCNSRSVDSSERFNLNAKQSHDFQRGVPRQVLWELRVQGRLRNKKGVGGSETMGGINLPIPRSCRSREEARVSSSNGRWIRQTGSLSARDFFSVNRLSRRNRRLSCRFFLLPSNQRRAILMYERNPELITERNNRGRSVG